MARIMSLPVRLKSTRRNRLGGGVDLRMINDSISFMNTCAFGTRAFCLFLFVFVLTANAQIQRVANTTLKMPAATTGSAAVARSRLVNWCRWVKAEAEAMANGLLEQISQAAEMVERRLESILGHRKEGLTTAFLEGLNSLFSETKRKARGHRSIEYQIAILYS